MAQSNRIEVYSAAPAEAAEVCEVTEGAAATFRDAADKDFLNAAPALAENWPPRIRAFFATMRHRERPTACIVSIDGLLPPDLTPTPIEWMGLPRDPKTRMFEFALVLMGCLLGTPFAWKTQQDGRLIHDVFPIPGHEHEQLGSSSLQDLSWHTEDAFHPFRSDYVVLGCLRNPHGVETIVASSAWLALLDDDRRILEEERFVIYPDYSHTARFNSQANSPDHFSAITAQQESPTVTAVLSSGLPVPYIRVDQDFMKPKPGDDRAAAALAAMHVAVSEALLPVVLEPGQFLVIDNCFVVHGRRSFVPHFDGTDRWLKRISVARSLRPAIAAGACDAEGVMT